MTATAERATRGGLRIWASGLLALGLVAAARRRCSTTGKYWSRADLPRAGRT